MTKTQSKRLAAVVQIASLPGLADHNEDRPASISDVLDAVWNAEQDGDTRFDHIAMTVDLVADIRDLVNKRPADPFRGL